MAKQKHTPGPWKVHGISVDTGAVTVNQPDYRIVIADVHNAASFGEMLSGAMRRGGGRLDPNDASAQFANARLIAAAPDLLAALELIASFEDLEADIEGAYDRALPMVKAAIAKAAGTQ